MRVRGRRRCQRCGEGWSYFETGSVECPACGSLRSAGVEDEPSLHTATPVTLDLSDARSRIGTQTIRDVAADAAEQAREYIVARGFVCGGNLLPLDDTFLAATELRHVSDRLRRALSPSEEAEWYFVTLLREAESGERPAADEVPDSMRSARGLAAVSSVQAYLSDLARWLDEHPDTAATTVLDRLREHHKRLAALDGDVPPTDADRLVDATRELGAYCRDGDESALAQARHRLDQLG